MSTLSQPLRRPANQIDKLKARAGLAPYSNRLKLTPQSGGNYKALCPFHDDHTPSLNVYAKKLRHHCFACGADGDALDLIQYLDGCDLPTARRRVEEIAGTPAKPKIENVYTYTDEAGQTLFQVVRYTGKEFHQRKPNGRGGWIYKLDKVRKPLYRLPEVIAASEVYFVEGEKDVETVRASGRIATTAAGGADAPWLPEYTETLKGKTVLISPDNDEKGRKRAAQVYAELKGVAEVRFIKIPAPHKDITDYVEAGGAIAHLNTVEAIEDDDWPEPESLLGTTESAPYPVDALPPIIRDAVEEVTAFNQAPVSMAACSALSAASLASQGLASVRRAEGLVGPISVYMLALLDSGERKTSTDDHFIAEIREYEKDMAQKAKPELAEFRAAEKSWAAKVKGAEARITAAARSGKPTAQLEKELEDLELSKPTAPRAPRLVYTDTTAEEMAWKLSERYPSAGVFSSEAGNVLGGHSMGRESVLRSLAFYNSAWDGRKSASDRRTQDSTRACPVRLTVWLAAQPEAVRAFVDGSRGLAMGTGFMGRFLISWPKSTQGTRLFKEAPTGWPKLLGFQRRLRELLEVPISFDDSGDLALDVLDLSPEAKRVWVEFHDSVERELSPSGTMASAREFAAKAADHAARMAAIFHIFTNGPTGKIEANTVKAACTVVAWHCMEALRFVGELAVPRPTANAIALEAWLVDRCQSGEAVSHRDVQRLGPGAVRDKEALQEALDVLTEANRARVIQQGLRRLVEVNPALLEGKR